MPTKKIICLFVLLKDRYNPFSLSWENGYYYIAQKFSTEQKKVSEEEFEEKYEKLLEESGEMIVFHGLGRIIYVPIQVETSVVNAKNPDVVNDVMGKLASIISVMDSAIGVNADITNPSERGYSEGQVKTWLLVEGNRFPLT